MKIHLLLLSLLVTFAIFAQEVTTTTQVLTGTAYGSTISVPINSNNITSIYGNIIIATIRVTYDATVLTYIGLANINATIQTFNRTVMPAGVGGVIQVNLEDPAFAGIAWPNGKAFDIQFAFKGGATPITITKAEFVDAVFDTYSAPVTNGNVSGFANLTATNGDWNTASNWTGGVTVPGIVHNAIIESGGTVVIDAAAVCNNLTVASGGQLTLNAGKTLTVNGNMEIASGGSFIQNGTLGVTGSTTAKRFIAGANWSLGTDGWHLLSSPVANQAISGSFTVPNYDFYAWNEPTLQWYNQKIGSHGINTFNVGQGYLVAYETSGTKEFVGTLNTADKSVNLTKSGSGATTSYGFNLLGNPYPSALTWATGWTLGNVNAVAKIWNSTGKSYSDIAAGNPIPAMNGFMVYTTANQALTIPAAARVHSSTAWYKSSDQQIKLIANDPEGASYQPSIIKFIADATTGFDLEYDSYMLTGFAPNFYSIADNSSFSLNALPEASSGLTIPFGFVKNASSNFNIELAESIDGYIIYLRDLKTNTVVNLSEKISYSFISEEGDDAKRFELFFGVLGVDNLDKLAAAAVYNVDNKIVVTNVSGKTKMDVYNVQGQLLNNYEFFSNGNHEISVNLPTGIYMVRLSNGGEMKTMKVIVK